MTESCGISNVKEPICWPEESSTLLLLDVLETFDDISDKLQTIFKLRKILIRETGLPDLYLRTCSMSSGRQRFFVVRAQNAVRCRGGRRRFYVTSRRIFADPEEFFERTMLGNETVMTHISKPAQFETGKPDLGPTVKCL